APPPPPPQAVSTAQAAKSPPRRTRSIERETRVMFDIALDRRPCEGVTWSWSVRRRAASSPNAGLDNTKTGNNVRELPAVVAEPSPLSRRPVLSFGAAPSSISRQL